MKSIFTICFIAVALFASASVAAANEQDAAAVRNYALQALEAGQSDQYVINGQEVSITVLGGDGYCRSFREVVMDDGSVEQDRNLIACPNSAGFWEVRDGMTRDPVVRAQVQADASRAYRDARYDNVVRCRERGAVRTRERSLDYSRIASRSRIGRGEWDSERVVGAVAEEFLRTIPQQNRWSTNSCTNDYIGADMPQIERSGPLHRLGNILGRL